LVVEVTEKAFELGFLLKDFVNCGMDGPGTVHQHGLLFEDKNTEITDVNQFVFYVN
jgi:hypothetical protein